MAIYREPYLGDDNGTYSSDSIWMFKHRRYNVYRVFEHSFIESIPNCVTIFKALTLRILAGARDNPLLDRDCL